MYIDSFATEGEPVGFPLLRRVQVEVSQTHPIIGWSGLSRVTFLTTQTSARGLAQRTPVPGAERKQDVL